MNLSTNALNQLAAAYALGTLKGGARRRFETLLARDPALRRLIGDWQTRLLPLHELQARSPIAAADEANEAVQAPPLRVWAQIAAQLNLPDTEPAPVLATARAAQAAPSFFATILDKIKNFQLFSAGGFVGASLAFGVLVLVGYPTGKNTGLAPEGQGAYTAMLKADKTPASLAVAASADYQTLQLRWQNEVGLAQALGYAPDRQSLQVWAIAPASAGLAPQSLGLLSQAQGTNTLRVSAEVAARLREQTAVIAISLEPLGGSPTAQAPSGPVIFKGEWVKVAAVKT